MPQTGSLNDILWVKPQRRVYLHSFMDSGRARKKHQKKQKIGPVQVYCGLKIYKKWAGITQLEV
jgi:hypothetical protein